MPLHPPYKHKMSLSLLFFAFWFCFFFLFVFFRLCVVEYISQRNQGESSFRQVTNMTPPPSAYYIKQFIFKNLKMHGIPLWDRDLHPDTSGILKIFQPSPSSLLAVLSFRFLLFRQLAHVIRTQHWIYLAYQHNISLYRWNGYKSTLKNNKWLYISWFNVLCFDQSQQIVYVSAVVIKRATEWRT